MLYYFSQSNSTFVKVLIQDPIQIDFGSLAGGEPWIGSHTFYTRGKFMKDKEEKKGSIIVYFGKNEDPGTDTYNPSTSAQIYCFSCRGWIHLEHTKQHKPSQPYKKEPLAYRAEALPVIRGGGWASLYPKVWKIVDNEFTLTISRAWLVMGTWLLACGVYYAPEHIAAAMFGDELSKIVFFECTFCDASL